MTQEILKRFGAWRECRSAEEMQDAAAEFASLLPEGEDCTLALYGDLGAGKTTFARGLARAFGVEQPITSPSFNIYAIYDGRSRRLIHMDAYRLPSARAVDALMLDEFMRSPWCWVVEWPEKIAAVLPPDTLCIEFEIVAAGTHRFRVFSPKK